MPTHIERPARIQSAGNMPKIIDEFFGRVNSKSDSVSIAHMRSPAGWQEPGQTPEFEEYTIVIRGKLRVRHQDGSFDVYPGQAVVAHPGEWIQYSTPDEATEYIAICLPAFSPQKVHRDDGP
jgi:ethanolamine utilization protein EutQ